MSISEPMTAETDTSVPELRIRGGLAGFPGMERFALVRWGDGGSPFSVLQSLDTEDLSFVVVPPAVFFPDYEPEVGDDVVDEIGIHTAEDAMVLAVVTVRRPVSTSTANLLGPLVVNVHELVGVQAVLDPDRYSAATPLAIQS